MRSKYDKIYIQEILLASVILSAQSALWSGACEIFSEDMSRILTRLKRENYRAKYFDWLLSIDGGVYADAGFSLSHIPSFTSPDPTRYFSVQAF